MDANRKTAIMVGVLFIIGTIAGILSGIVTGPVMGDILGQTDPAFLIKAAGNGNQMITGAIFILIMGLSLAMVPLVSYPILRKHDQVLALGYVVFRGALETVTYGAMAICMLLVVVLSQLHAQATVAVAPYFQTLGALLLAAQDALNTILEIIFPLGALMFYTVLYRARLIPRWLSGWGLIGASVYLAVGVLALFSVDLNPLLFFLAVQEMVMAVWLILKGFSQPAGSVESVRVDLSYGEAGRGL